MLHNYEIERIGSLTLPMAPFGGPVTAGVMLTLEVVLREIL